MSTYQKTVLKNGLTIVTDFMEHVESVSVGAYVRSGSRAETVENNGVAHFLEHMAFKGTKKRTAEQIAKEVEDVGGQMNAYTSRETTAYHMKVLKENMPLAVDIIGDILTNSTFLAEELERERGVILQEIGMTQDTPDDMVFDNLQEVMFPNQPLGRPILGTVETVKNMSREQLQNFIDERYSTKNMVIAAAGHVNHNAFVDEVTKAFAGLPTHTVSTPKSGSYNCGKTIKYKDIEQVHIAISWQGIQAGDPQNYNAAVWCSVLGDGMASRLFQEIREKRGLVYSIFSYMSAYSDVGTFGVYAGTDKKDVPELIKVLTTELEKARNIITNEEINRAKAQLKASVRMSQESTDARMGRMAQDIFVHSKRIPLAEILQKIDAVTIESACAAAKAICNETTRSISLYGPITEGDIKL